MSFIDDLADALARDVLDAQVRLGDDRFYEKVGKVLGTSSPTLQEAFLTSVRIRLAEERGREFLRETLAELQDVESAQATAEVSDEVKEVAAPPSAPKAPADPAKPVLSAAARARLISESAFGPTVTPAASESDL